MARQSILFIMSSSQMGGPQKSLLGFLQRVDPAVFEASVMFLDSKPGPLHSEISRHATIVKTPSLVRATTLPRSGVLRSLWTLVWRLRPKNKIRAFAHLVRALVSRKPGNVVRQELWVIARQQLKTLPAKYDAAIGILGSSTYAVVDIVDARYKYHWVRSDTRILKRDIAIDRAYYSKLDGALSVSPQCTNIFEEYYPELRGHVLTYKNDTAQLDGPTPVIGPWAAPAVHRILTVTRLDPLKGLDLAIDACAELVARDVAVQWIVLGEGRERAVLEKYSRDRGVDGHFHLFGTVMDIAPFLEEADVVVHPSRTEGRSNAVEEARAHSKPIVATAYDTVEDQVEHMRTGVVVPIEPKAIADAVEYLLLQPGLARRLGMAAGAAHACEKDDPNSVLGHLVSGSIATAVAAGTSDE